MTVRNTSATAQVTAIAIAMSPAALRLPVTAGSRHVVETSARATAHSPIAVKNSDPSRRPNAPTMRTTVRTARIASVATPSMACDGTDGRAGRSDPHGPGGR